MQNSQNLNDKLVYNEENENFSDNEQDQLNEYIRYSYKESKFTSKWVINDELDMDSEFNEDIKQQQDYYYPEIFKQSLNNRIIELQNLNSTSNQITNKLNLDQIQKSN
ncbi:hypothetical protein PPERSA_04409 [Pseudocohnilembus persalinus]|uniref:Uncharacterized protein n=1 Tax=Pseudocohnilembus persalinus TaxID=266149 RepID=A0A0V0QQL0_PSEPJ|nr:hypothetical protein PPERSA_04409 [Pseudocohnilembus persalinus]|eukprot:KRX04594.1 hypothetical protein PPERSA_04409 [Pseudocohnilembus persalinus]